MTIVRGHAVASISSTSAGGDTCSAPALPTGSTPAAHSSSRGTATLSGSRNARFRCSGPEAEAARSARFSASDASAGDPIGASTVSNGMLGPKMPG
ncbi:hypothetical protein ACFPRL_33445 [Pseudoclavibacter helvolus]